MSKPLLVTLDGSALGETVLPWAVYLARARKLSLVLARAVAWPLVLGDGMAGSYLTPEMYDEVLAAERQAATEYLEAVRQRLASEGPDVEIAVRAGEPAEALLDLADELGAYAIAMTTHGRGGLARVVLGSVAERVLQHTTRPILLVRAGTAQPGRDPSLDRILVPLDGSLLAERSLDVARELGTDGTTLMLVRVVAPLRRVTSAVVTAMAVDEDATRRAVTRADEYLARVKRGLDQVQRPSQTRVRLGATNQGDEILAEAREADADLIVMATHGRTGPDRWLLGSVADHVVRRSELPVLLVSARALAARVVGAFTAGDVMTREPATVRDDEPLSVVLRKLLRRRVSGAPVVNAAGDLVGVVSEHDLLGWHARLAETVASAAMPAPAEYARRLDHDTVNRIMSQPPVTIEQSAPLSAAIGIFQQRKLRRLPVMHAGRLVGILSRADVLRAMTTQWESTSAKPPARADGGADTPADGGGVR